MKDKLLATCRVVSQRATQTLNWIQAYSGHSLLGIAVDHITLGRAALYEAVISGGSPSSFILPTSFLNSAVSGLGRSGNMDDLPRGLLTRAWLRFLTGARNGPAIW